ncbi:MAG TPA: RNA polymerase sigma factor [Nitrospiria bacterium]
MVREDPDRELMLRFQKGDEGAFEALFKKYAPSLINFSFRFLGSRMRAEEAAQEVLIKVYQARQDYRPEARFSTWIYRIATNFCLNEVRRPENRYKKVAFNPAPEGEDEVPLQIPDEQSPRPEEDLAYRRLDKAFQNALTRLPDRQRAAFLLSRFENATYLEVARTLGCSESSVRSLIHRASVAIREELKEFIEP